MNRTAQPLWLKLVRLLGACYAVTLLISTHIPLDNIELVGNWDKLIHFHAYFVLGALAVLAQLPSVSPRWPKLQLIAWLMLFGACDEFTQGFVNRTPDVRDWLFDAAGVVVAVLVIHVVGVIVPDTSSVRDNRLNP